MNIPPPPPPHRRKTPSFSSSLLDSILRSIDDDDVDHHHHHHHHQQQVNDDDLMFFPSEPKWSSKNEQTPSLRGAVMIDQWMETHNNRNRNGYASRKSCREFVSDSSSNATTTFSSETDTPSTYRSLPNSFTVSRETVFGDDNQKVSSKFMKSTKLRAMKIYGKVKQPMSPGSRISAFIYSLFASSSSSSSSKKVKIEESMQNLRSLKKSRSIKVQDTPTTTCTSFSRSCMSKKQHNNSSVKRSVRFYPENDIDRKSNHQCQSDSRRWFTEKKFMVNIEDDEDEDEDDLFELEITGAYTQELPVFETTDLRKIRI